MCFIHDHREAFARQLTHTVHDHAKFLQGTHDDTLAVFQRRLEILGGHAVIGGDIDQHALGLDHLRQGALQLPVDHAAVGNNDHRTKHRLAVGRVQGG